MPLFAHGDVVLAYEETGDGSPPLVLLHGLSSARSTWAPVTLELARAHRVLAVDQRGHGESTHVPGTYTLDHYGADAVAFCAEVVGEPAVLFGHSLGGVVAAWVTRERPDLVLGAVLEDPPLYRGQPDDSGPEGIAVFFPVMRDLFRSLRDQRAPLEEYEAVVRAAPALHGVGTMADVLGPAGTTAQAQAWAGLDPEVFTPVVEGGAFDGADPDAPLSRPMLVLRGDPDLRPAFTADDEARFLRANPRATVEVVPGASHAIHDEQPEVAIEAVSRFVEKLT